MPAEAPFKSVMLNDALFDFQAGVNSGIQPRLLPRNQLGNAINATVRGDFVGPRPPYNQLTITYDGGLQEAVENGLWQGCAFYKDDYGNPFLVAAISGRLFLFTPTGTGFNVTEITIPGDPNPATVPQAWLWQSEKWLIWQDGQSVPVFYDGATSRRAAQGAGVIAKTVTTAFAIPAIGKNVTLTLVNPYTGPFNTLVALYDDDITNPNANFLGYFQTLAAGGASPVYNVVLKNTSGASRTINTGDTVIVPATAGTTNLVGFVQNSQSLPSPGAFRPVVLQSPIPANLSGSLSTIILQSGQACNATGFVVGGTTGNLALQSDGPVTITGQALRAFGGINNPPSPSHPVGNVLGGPFTIANGASATVTLDQPYAGPSGAIVTVNGFTYTITPAAPPPPANTLTLLNLSGVADTGAATSIKIGSTVRNVPELPPGRMGVYGLGRNWQSSTDGKSFVASDQVGGSSGTPAFNRRDAVLHFQENSFLAGGGAFPVPSEAGEITAMRFISNLDTSLGQGPLMVHTPDVVFSCLAGQLTDRVNWQDVTNPILTEALKPRGGLSQNSTINASSDSLFRTALGIQSLILGRRDFDVWGNVPQSFEVEPTLDADNQSLLGFSSAIEFDNRMLMTANPIQVPQGVYHTKLVALNYDPVSSLRGKQPSVYDGIWQDLNILQLLVGRFLNTERAFAFCFNPDMQKIELWEILPSSSNQIQDNELQDIVLDIESPIIDFGEKDPTERNFKRLEDGEIEVQDVQGDVKFQTFFRPDFDPIWHPWYEWCISDMPSWQPRMGLGEPPKKSDDSTGRLTRDGYFFQWRLVITGHCIFMGAKFRASTQPQPMFAKPLPPCAPEPAIDFLDAHPPVSGVNISAPSAYWAFENYVDDGAGASHFVDSTPGNTNLNFATVIFGHPSGKIGLGVDQGDSGHSLVNLGAPALGYSSGGLSFSFWLFMISESGTFNVGPVVSDRLGGFDHGIRIQNNGTTTLMNQIVVFCGGAGPTTTFSPAIPNLTWTHIVFTLTDAGAFVFYVNGVPVLTGNAGAPISHQANGEPLVNQNFGGSTYKIDELGFWVGHVLTADEVTSLYNRGTGVTYPFS